MSATQSFTHQMRLQQGVTLLELLLVMGIFLTIGTAATSYTARFFTQNNVTNTTDHLVSQLRKAQHYALMGKQNGGAWGVRYTTTPSPQITLFLSGSTAFDEKYPVASSMSVTGFTEITFAHLTGIPTPTGPTTITITGTGSSESITINTQGVISRN